MKRLFIATAAAAALATPVLAADLPAVYPTKAPPAYVPAWSWTGFYVGVNGGGGWGRTSHTAAVGLAGIAGLPALTTGNFNTSGGLAGGTAGYNYQMGQWVFGMEADLDWSNINGTFTTVFAVPGVTATAALSSRLNWLDTVRVRAGWAWDRALLYGTAGAAYGGLTATAAASFAVPGFAAAATVADTQTRFGWTAGGGVEYAFTNNVTAKVEYLYVDLGSQNQLLIDNVKFTTNIVRGGLNFKF
jgi:outer membrane immunogenic protein